MKELLSALSILALGFAGWAGYVLQPRMFVFSPAAQVPSIETASGRPGLRLPGRALIAEVGEYRDDFFGYLMFDYLRSRRASSQVEVFLTSKEAGPGPVYAISIHPQDDLLQGIPTLARLEAAGLIPSFHWRFITWEALGRKRQQSRLFESAYSLPARRTLQQLAPSELAAYTERFLRFKSITDRRVQERMQPIPPLLSRAEASRLAADIIDVAEFYRLPLDSFLAIGAMENNYMNVTGDLQHAVWKRRAEPGDVILKRRRGQVLVRNEAWGVWQITRETLRYAHRLYLKDQRDYSLLPERLRPPRKLNLEETNPEVLTTYAGLLFRELLDRFHGDLPKAVGAYNGGPARPNMEYEAGVRLVADYAKRIFEHAAALNGQPLAQVRFLVPTGSTN